jgi:uncharacterized membrane protein YhaH (DUF805 family)
MTRYLDFARLATRSEYWAVLIITWISVIVAWSISLLFIAMEGIMVAFGGIFLLASTGLFLWITLAVTASRCRDAALNPWWAASILLPYIGFVTMIVFGCLESRSAEPIE